MWGWYRRWRRPVVLHVMRLEDMHRVHPDMIRRTCQRCGAVVGVYPSGQRVIAKFGKRRTHLVCQVCLPIDYSNLMVLAPGALSESAQSRDR